MKPRHVAVVCAVLAAVLGPAARAACEAASGPRTAALVELYTSEGCSSCPPADRRLGRLREALAPGALAVPLALHVAWWDAIGWRDPYAQAAFGERQRFLVQAGGGRTPYTPQFFVAGGEVRDWEAALRDAVKAVNARPAAADVRVSAAPAAAGTLAIGAEAVTKAAQADGAAPQLFLAVTESGLVSRVLRGENAGATLGHDAVVREWIGPVALVGGKASVRREVALPAHWRRDRLGVVAFVQDARSGRVLQAVAAAQCGEPS